MFSARRLQRNQDHVRQIDQLYLEKLPISILKKKDLEDLCKKNVIPTKYHDEYLNMQSNNTVRDVLPETDEEDCDSIEKEL